MLEMGPGHFGGRNQKSRLFLYKIPYVSGVDLCLKFELNGTKMESESSWKP